MLSDEYLDVPEYSTVPAIPSRIFRWFLTSYISSISVLFSGYFLSRSLGTPLPAFLLLGGSQAVFLAAARGKRAGGHSNSLRARFLFLGVLEGVLYIVAALCSEELDASVAVRLLGVKGAVGVLVERLLLKKRVFLHVKLGAGLVVFGWAAQLCARGAVSAPPAAGSLFWAPLLGAVALEGARLAVFHQGLAEEGGSPVEALGFDGLGTLLSLLAFAVRGPLAPLSWDLPACLLAAGMLVASPVRGWGQCKLLREFGASLPCALDSAAVFSAELISAFAYIVSQFGTISQQGWLLSIVDVLACAVGLFGISLVLEIPVFCRMDTRFHDWGVYNKYFQILDN